MPWAPKFPPDPPKEAPFCIFDGHGNRPLPLRQRRSALGDCGPVHAHSRDGVGVMSAASWKDVGDFVIGWVAKEPPFTQIMIGLGAAFGFLMVLEGLRVNFLPQRRQRTNLVSRSANDGRSAARSQHVNATSYRSIREDAPPPTRNPKKRERIVRRHQALRPGIHRNPIPANSWEQTAPANDFLTDQGEGAASGQEPLAQVATSDG